jgi:hypothetical protein
MSSDGVREWMPAMQIVAVLFGELRAEAGGATYVPMMSDYRHREDAAQWAEAEAARWDVPPERVLRASMAEFFRNEDARAASYPFKMWASDPGRWLTTAMRERAKRRSAEAAEREAAERRRKAEAEARRQYPGDGGLPREFWEAASDEEASRIALEHIAKKMAGFGELEGGEGGQKGG